MPSGIYLHKKQDLAQRFWKRVDMSGGPDACWPWQGACSSGGYGAIAVEIEGKYVTVGAHIVAYEIQIGPVPEGMHILHKCDNPPCMNGSHFFTGTNLDNIRDRHAKGRTSHASRNRGFSHPHAKFTDEQCETIRLLRKNGVPRYEVAATFKIHPVYISQICSGKRRG